MINYKNFYLKYQELKTIVCDFEKKHKNYRSNYYINGFYGFCQNNITLYINFVNFLLIERYLKNLTDKEVNILDFGCGMGDKSVILREIFKKANIIAMETKINDDHYAVDHQPYKVYKNIYSVLKRKYSINFELYDGKTIDAQDNYFDIILLYAVVEHIRPEKRQDIINSLSDKLKKGGYLVITRCPSYYSFTEFVARKLGLTTHQWLLKKDNLLGLFDKQKYKITVLKKLSNIPAQPNWITQRISSILIVMDKMLQFIGWPFASEYFLIVKNEY